MIPPSGNNLFPGKMMASSNMIGANTLAAAQISARPAKKGQSKPMLMVRPFSRLLAKSVILVITVLRRDEPSADQREQFQTDGSSKG